VATTALQVFSRVVLINLVAFVPAAQASAISQLMIGAWALVEVVRYPYYALGLVSDAMPFAFTWTRYSIFLFDYPLGVFGELGTLYTSLDFLREHVGAWGYYLTIALMCTYIWGLPKMYFFMLGQRKKYLSGATTASDKKKKDKKAN